MPRVPPRPGTQGAPGPGEQTAASAPSGADQLVLVIDDDTAIRRVIERVLLQNGFRVVTAQDGVDAVARLISLGAEIRLVITDLLMPRLDGCAVAQAIRKSYPQTRIVGMSGHAPEEVAERPSSAGFDVFLRKPFSYDELLAAVRAALAPDLRASPPPQSSGDAESGGDPAV